MGNINIYIKIDNPSTPHIWDIMSTINKIKFAFKKWTDDSNWLIVKFWNKWRDRD